MLELEYLERVNGGDNMNSAALKGKIMEANMTQSIVAEKIGISLSRFNAKINETSGAEFSLGEIRAIKKLLKLSPGQLDSIFFDEKVS